MHRRFLAATLFSLLVPAAASADDAPGERVLSNPRIDLGFVVADLAESRAFYETVLGFRKTGEINLDGPKAKSLGLTDGRRMDIHVMTGGEGPGATRLKLIEFPGLEPMPVPRSYAHTALGVGYFTYYVADLDEALARAKRLGAEPHADGPVPLGPGRALAIVTDPDGNLLELIGPLGE